MNTPTSIYAPTHKLGRAMQHMQEQGKRPCFRIEGIRITMASSTSANPGSLYIKDDNWDYIGKINTMGYMTISYATRITEAQKMIVQDAIVNPEGTAMANGKKTGTCCCCGRTLTNKLSIELGIGPICRGYWFPDSIEPIEATTVREPDMPLSTNPMDTLDDEYVVKILAAKYHELTPQQKDMFVLEVLDNTTKGAGL